LIAERDVGRPAGREWLREVPARERLGFERERPPHVDLDPLVLDRLEILGEVALARRMVAVACERRVVAGWTERVCEAVRGFGSVRPLVMRRTPSISFGTCWRARVLEDLVLGGAGPPADDHDVLDRRNASSLLKRTRRRR
jgi:hypothetical protein